jgi:hypothetical protein
MLSVPAPFPRRTIVAPQDKLIVLGTNEGPFVDFLRRGDGTWTRIEWRQSARPVERGHLELFVEALVGSAGGGREQLRQILSTALLPKELPWYDAIVVAQDSSIWIREYALPGEDSSLWRVLEPTGHLNATAMLPSSFVPTRIGADGLLGIATDSLNVERVMRFRLIDP